MIRIKYDIKLARNEFDVVFKLKAPNLKILVARTKMIPKVIKDLRNAIKTVATTIKMIISHGGIVSQFLIKRNHRL